MCGRPDVGLGNVSVLDSCRRYHRADSFPLEHAIASSRTSRTAKNSARVAEWCGGALDVETEAILIIGTPPAGTGNHRRPSAVSRPAAISDYWALTKPEVNFLIAIATFTGFYLAVPGPLGHFPWLRLVHTLLGTLLVASGTGTLNQYIERRFDAQMRRTSR